MIPLTVSQSAKETYEKNSAILTRKSSNLLFFVFDQYLEHLQFDLYGDNVSRQAQKIEHAFSIAANSNMSAFITYLGLISRYGEQFSTIPYIVKLTGKIPIRTFTDDAYNFPLYSVEDVIRFKQESGLIIVGVAAVVYLGSIYEKEMLQNAQKMILDAHKHGLVNCLFLYIRASKVNSDDPMLLAGAAGVANVLGADIVKLHVPEQMSEEQLLRIKNAAGNTRIIVAGGKKVDDKKLVDRYASYIRQGFCAGAALGRNVFQRDRQDAISLIQQISSIKMTS